VLKTKYKSIDVGSRDEPNRRGKESKETVFRSKLGIPRYPEISTDGSGAQ
jgi:hypothetical protein